MKLRGGVVDSCKWSTCQGSFEMAIQMFKLRLPPFLRPPSHTPCGRGQPPCALLNIMKGRRLRLVLQGCEREGCYWRPAATAAADTQPSATGEPAGSLLLITSTCSVPGQPSLLPSPDSTHSEQNVHDQPVSGSSQEEEEGSSTQASELAALSAGTVTFSVGEDETPVHEISSCDSPKPVNEGAEKGYGLEVFSPLVVGIWRQESEPLGLV